MSRNVATTLLFARHGESEANVTRTFSNRDLPHSLTDRGIEHARTLALRFAQRGIDQLWCSPVPRAVETAAIIGASLGLTHQVTDALREFDVGRFEGTSSEAGWEEYGSVMHSWLDGDHERRVGGGESLTEIVARLRQFLDSFLDEELDGICAGFIAHGGLYRMALPYLLANISPQFGFENVRGYGQLIVAKAKDREITCVDWDGILIGEDA